ncbi:MAG: capsular biosynthesis protein [Alphaproteobacteria bacterium]|nr:capsular biosynthesis protein [Alphaproteobacteria bacterium]
MANGSPAPVPTGVEGNPRHFLLLQGPCGPFYRHLQRELEAAGHRCTRVAINGGDFISGLLSGIRVFRRSFADWPAWIEALAHQEGVTDLICYGDCRPYHKAAINSLGPLGVAVHVLEEGYLRPSWITCESQGVNGYSPLASVDLDRIDHPDLNGPLSKPEVELKSTHWNYVLSGFLYYGWNFLLTPLFPRYESHRDLDVLAEAALWTGRIASWPRRRFRATRAVKAITNLGKPIHLVLLQLNGDAQIREHSSFSSTRHFAEFCLKEFAASGSTDSILVFKNHPLDNGVIDIGRVIHDMADQFGLAERVFFVETGKLVPLLERAISVTAINSTACHQALLRGIPTMVLGRAVFNHPQIVAQGRLADFFRLRPCKDSNAYRKLVNLMRNTCQYNGGYYSQEGRSALMPALTKALIHGAPAPADFETVPVKTPGRKAS